ncbi:MAG TPA: DUF6295 family protein [Acidimicrobiales bacterium]|nr:DUF6295 family protein [Acidimicrobiales bacterium]
MCTYQTERLALRASGKTAEGWTRLTDATVYFDHPVHFPAGHALMIDVLNPERGASARVGLELDADSARALAEAILRRLGSIASAHGLVASPQKTAYVAAKHGLVGLTKAVALETAATGVTCNAICPGWVLTPLVQKQIDALAASHRLPLDEAKAKLLAEKQPSLEFATPEQIGAIAVFLCSPAADQIRGAALSVDGGWTAQ